MTREELRQTLREAIETTDRDIKFMESVDHFPIQHQIVQRLRVNRSWLVLALQELDSLTRSEPHHT